MLYTVAAIILAIVVAFSFWLFVRVASYATPPWRFLTGLLVLNIVLCILLGSILEKVLP